eukprot:scaffold448_cov156-Amphora_coffeaeformis.AAC.15
MDPSNENTMKDSEEDISSFQSLGIDWNEPVERSSKSRLWLGALIAGSTVVGTLALTAPFVLSRSPLPYMATPGHKIKKALEFIQIKSGQKQTRIFVDLGSGDGEGVYQAVRTGYQQAVGIELNWTLCTLSRIRRQFFWEHSLRRRSQFLNQDFFPYSLAQADTCMIFGVTPLMEPISRKLALECAPGTHVLAYRFKLPLVTENDPKLLNAEIVYDVEEMRVYECR